MENHCAHSIIKNGFQVVVGSGERVRLWHDIHWDNIPLKGAFPRIFALASNKEGMISECGRWENENWLWDIELRRSFFDWEFEQWNCFLLSLANISVKKNLGDVLAWSYCPNGIFSVSLFKRCLESNNGTAKSFIDFLWKGFVPPKVEVFMWQLLIGRILVKDVLRKFGVGQVSNFECPFCGFEMESIDHFFSSLCLV